MVAYSRRNLLLIKVMQHGLLICLLKSFAVTSSMVWLERGAPTDAAALSACPLLPGRVWCGDTAAQAMDLNPMDEQTRAHAQEAYEHGYIPLILIRVHCTLNEMRLHLTMYIYFSKHC